MAWSLQWIWEFCIADVMSSYVQLAVYSQAKAVMFAEKTASTELW